MSERVPMTPAGYQALKKELKRLKSVDRPENVREIEEALGHGDLSENAEYHAAKERQGLLNSRITQLEDRLARAQVIETVGSEDGKIRFGATVELEDVDSGETIEYVIVGEDEADAAEGRISVTSPVARALLGKEEGDEVSVQVPKGTRNLEVLAVR